MPTVPSYGQLKVRTEALPGVRKQSSASTFQSEGGGVAQAQEQLGDTIARLGVVGVAEIQAAERKRADEIGKLKLLDGFNQVDQKLLYDQQNGFLTKQGEQPHALTQQYVGEYDKQVGALAALAKSPEQQAYYEQLRVTRGDAFRNQVDQHASREYDKFEAQTFDATMEGSINTAIAAGADHLDAVRDQLTAQDQAIAAHGARLGMSPQAQQLLKAKSHAAVHAGIVEGLLNDPTNINRAQAYFDETKDVIAAGDPKAAERIDHALKEGGILAQAQSAADGILAAFKNEADARDAAKIQLKDPKVRAQALDLIEHDFAVRKTEERDAHEKLILGGLNIAEQSGTWTAIPRSQWLQYTVGERASIQEYLRAKAAGTTIKTDPNVWAGLMLSAYSDDPAERDVFLNVDPLKLRGSLSNSDFEQVIKMRQAMRTGDHNVGVDEKFQQNLVNDSIVSMGLPTNPIEPGKKDFDPIVYERVGAFRSAVRSAVTRLEASQNGKKATDADVQSIVDQLRTRVAGQQRVTRPGVIKNSYGQAYAFEVPQAQVGVVGDIPATERRRIESALRAEGKPVTDAAVLALFNLKLSLTRKDR